MEMKNYLKMKQLVAEITKKNKEKLCNSFFGTKQIYMH